MPVYYQGLSLIHISETESGYLEFSYDGRDYDKVDLTRLVPFNDENRYISVSLSLIHI